MFHYTLWENITYIVWVSLSIIIYTTIQLLLINTKLCNQLGLFCLTIIPTCEYDQSYIADGTNEDITAPNYIPLGFQSEVMGNIDNHSQSTDTSSLSASRLSADHLLVQKCYLQNLSFKLSYRLNPFWIASISHSHSNKTFG